MIMMLQVKAIRKLDTIDINTTYDNFQNMDKPLDKYKYDNEILTSIQCINNKDMKCRSFGTASPDEEHLTELQPGVMQTQIYEQ